MAVEKAQGVDDLFDDDVFDDEGVPAYCDLCDGSGVIVICVDDMCRGAGECMHGDGEQLCPNGCDPY